MKELIGTWKSAGTIQKNGQITSQKAPVTFTFREDGTGTMRYLLVMSADFTWEQNENNIIIHNTVNSGEQKFVLAGDTLTTFNTNGTKAVFRKKST